MNEECVFENDDLRRYIFSFLRKEPRKKCTMCGDVCVWDKTVKYYIAYGNNNNNVNCTECWIKNFNGPGCRIV